MNVKLYFEIEATKTTEKIVKLKFIKLTLRIK